MINQTILACDDNGKFLEYIPKEVGHTGKGKRHLAIAVLVVNSQGEVLLQKRKHKVFDNIWDLTGATHPLHKQDGSDESSEEATRRCLEDEYGITEKIPLENLGFFNYFAKIDGLCENEHCAMMIGSFDGQVKLNPSKGYEYKWVDQEDLLVDMEKNPKKYSPWANAGLKLLKKANYFCDYC